MNVVTYVWNFKYKSTSKIPFSGLFMMVYDFSWMILIMRADHSDLIFSFTTNKTSLDASSHFSH